MSELTIVETRSSELHPYEAYLLAPDHPGPIPDLPPDEIAGFLAYLEQVQLIPVAAISSTESSLQRQIRNSGVAINIPGREGWLLGPYIMLNQAGEPVQYQGVMFYEAQPIMDQF